MLLFSFSIFSDRRSLKIENENNKKKTQAAEVSYMGLGSLVFRFIHSNPGWLELPLTRTNFHGPNLFEPSKFYCNEKQEASSKTSIVGQRNFDTYCSFYFYI